MEWWTLMYFLDNIEGDGPPWSMSHLSHSLRACGNQESPRASLPVPVHNKDKNQEIHKIIRGRYFESVGKVWNSDFSLFCLANIIFLISRNDGSFLLKWNVDLIFMNTCWKWMHNIFIFEIAKKYFELCQCYWYV